MYPILDFDVLLLMAVALASKRRAAELTEIVSAAELIQGSMPPDAKLAEAFTRLSAHGLIAQDGDGYQLTLAAQDVVATRRGKSSVQERFSDIKDNLKAYQPAGQHDVIAVTVEAMAAAMKAHQTAARNAKRHLLTPKPKVAENSNKRYDQRRRFGAAPRRKKD